MTRTIVLLGALLSAAFALPQHNAADIKFPKRQNNDAKPPIEARAQAVIDTFRISWDGYAKYAFPNDELKPVTNGFSNSRYLSTLFHQSEKLNNILIVEMRGEPRPWTP
jgi:hypothetical protein